MALVQDAAHRQRGACAKCGHRNKPGWKLRLVVERDPRHGRRLVCMGPCPDYREVRPSLSPEALEAAIADIALRMPGSVVYGPLPSRGRGRPRLISPSRYATIRSAITTPGRGAPLRELVRRLAGLEDLPERTFERYERQYERARAQTRQVMATRDSSKRL